MYITKNERIKKNRIMMTMFGIIMVMLQNTAHAFNIHAPVAANTPSQSPSPLVYGIIMTGLSTHISLHLVQQAPLPQLERRRVIQSIGCCAIISAGEIMHESKRTQKKN